MTPTCIDLFAGCGGLSLGLGAAGFTTRLSVEAHADAFATYTQNLLDRGGDSHQWPDWLEKRAWLAQDVLTQHKSELGALRGQIDLIAGGPPCQGFSTNGLRRPDDPRSRMVDVYLAYVELIKPKIILLENVVGFHTMRHQTGVTYSEYVVGKLKTLGYDASFAILKASDWGVPQKRPRFILIGTLAGSMPGVDPILRLRVARKEFLARKGLGLKPTTAKEALSDLEEGSIELPPDPEWGHLGFKTLRRAAFANSSFQILMRAESVGQPSNMRLPRHSRSSTVRMQAILDSCPKGTCISPDDRERLGIKKRSTTPLSADSPSPTISTLPDDFIHYSRPRAMSVREHARLQSFPDWFDFKGPYTTGGKQRKEACPRFTQVGNAVPPLLAEAIGETIKELLLIQSNKETLHLSDGIDIRSEHTPDLWEVADANVVASL